MFQENNEKTRGIKRVERVRERGSFIKPKRTPYTRAEIGRAKQSKEPT